MDREWINADRLDPRYRNGVNEFVKHAVNNAENIDEIYCPCVKCGNNIFVNVGELKDHLLCNGIDKSYTRWIWHGEDVKPNVHTENNDEEVFEEDDFDIDVNDRIDDMINDAKQLNEQPTDLLEKLASDGTTKLYPGCSKFTRLSATLKLYNLKAKNGWSDKSFTCLLELLHEILPDGNELPTSTYEAKKILCPMGADYQRIHACPKNHILFRKDYKDLDQCPKCGSSRYKLNKKNSDKKKGAPSKVLWYLPVNTRFKRLFANPTDAQNLVWHAEGRVKDDKIRHPSDSTQWKTIDFLFPEFGSDARNLRLGLSTDGMNPFGSLSSQWSTWPVMLTIYNLPPWLCMKRKYIMLTLLISGPKQPGNDIDVFLEPLIDDLKLLWNDGVEVYDAYRAETFRLRAMVFCTINDFPAYGNLSGYTVKGAKACPICENDTVSDRLHHGGKNVYLSHRRFLNRSHPYRRKMKAFNGRQELRDAPKQLSGREVFEKVKNIENSFGKPYKPPSNGTLYKKRSIFWELPYWQHLSVRHCIDVMHVEKNVCESLVGTLLNIPGKTKDGIKAREDMVAQKIRLELAPQLRGSRTYLPPACYTLSRKEKTSVCECLHSVKVPQGYSSNIKNIVSLKELKLVGLKSHDCHILMQQLLPIALRGVLPKHVRHAITSLCYFFNAIYNKVVDADMLNALQRDIVITLCQLEMFFPPSFFDIMVHLVVHLVREIKICGPVFLRNMYPFERYMKPLGGYVRNTNRPEGCIIQGYVAEEALEFTRDYLSNVESIGIPISRHEGRLDGKGTLGRKVMMVSRDTLDQAHFYILQHMADVHPFIEHHQMYLREKNPSKGDRWLAIEHNRSFVKWFSDEVQTQMKQNPSEVSENVRWLADLPNLHVISYEGYDINGYSFYTKSQDDRSTMQNSGVALMAMSMSVASAKDKNPAYDDMTYFGVIQEIWELDYVKFKVPVFRCMWVDHKGIKVDEMGFTLVDLKREGYKSEPFIMANQAKQVFYVTDPVDTQWSIVLHGKRKFLPQDNMDEVDDELPPFSSGLPPVAINTDDEDDFYIREDHGEGLWIEPPKTSSTKYTNN